jgi:hypothetical protein
MDLVTVTCKRDIQQMILQAESIQKFLAPCTHWVVINDQDVDITKWKTILEPYYTDHTLKFWVPDWNNHTGVGWDKQQVYKFTVSQFLDDDYVVLDSKNFFIKQTNINNWRNILGSGHLEKINEGWPKWQATNNHYADYFKSMPLRAVLAVQTPFVFKIAITKKLDDDFILWFNSSEIMPSEFLCYSYLLQPEQIVKTKCVHKTFWPSDYNQGWDVTLYNIENINPKTTVMGFHRNFLNQLSVEEFNKVNQWIASRQLTTRLTPQG